MEDFGVGGGGVAVYGTSGANVSRLHVVWTGFLCTFILQLLGLGGLKALRLTSCDKTRLFALTAGL